jgi:hypothetical protein
MDYARILRQRRYLDLKFAVEGRDPQLLAAELRRAAAEHHIFEAENGPDEDWASWYAGFLVGLIEVPSDRAESAPTKEELAND